MKILIKKSQTPYRYVIYFLDDTDTIIGQYTTPNGNIVDLGKVVNNFLHHEYTPLGAVMKESGATFKAKDKQAGSNVAVMDIHNNKTRKPAKVIPITDENCLAYLDAFSQYMKSFINDETSTNEP